jgi:HD domain
MEDPAVLPTDANPGSGPVAEVGPEHVVYRRRQQDWLSDGSPMAVAGDQPRDSARWAAIEVAKATLIARDGLTSDHSDDVGLLCTAIANEFHIDERAKDNLMAAAQLHDIGKVGVPESILQKPGPLTADEWAVIHEHTIVGERILSSVPDLREVARLVRHSHEHWDGSGYPDGLSGEEIPLESRIILCADAFHAIRSPRPYREGRPALEAYEEIRAYRGSQFDPKVVDALGRTIEGVRDRQRTGRPFFSTRAVLGNRRLAALLLALSVAGSAFAAVQLGGGQEAEAHPESTPCEDCFGAPASTFAGPPGVVARTQPPRRATAAVRRRVGRSAGGAAGPRGGGAAPKVERVPAARRRSGRAVTQPPRRSAAAIGAGPTTAGGGSAPAKVKVKKPKKVHPTKGPPPHGNAYGHEKRLENPHPPKPPPGRVKPGRVR